MFKVSHLKDDIKKNRENDFTHVNIQNKKSSIQIPLRMFSHIIQFLYNKLHSKKTFGTWYEI